VISANTVALSEEARWRLYLYVREGGSLLIGMNPDLSPELFHTSVRELLPGRIRAVSPSRVDRDQFRLLTEVKDLHPIFQPFAGPRRGDFSAVRFFKTAQLEADSSALVLGNFDDGTIALAEKQIEAGRSLLFLSTFDLTWNDLPIREVFVPFLYEMVDYLAGSSGRNREETRLYSRIAR